MAEEMNPNAMGERPQIDSLMSPEELQTLDEAINPKTARVLMKLLPELEQIINQVGGQSQQRQAPAKMGALGGVR